MTIFNDDLRPALRKCFPELGEEELAEAEENFRRYVALTVRMYSRLRNNPEAFQQFKALTDSEK